MRAQAHIFLGVWKGQGPPQCCFTHRIWFITTANSNFLWYEHYFLEISYIFVDFDIVICQENSWKKDQINTLKILIISVSSKLERLIFRIKVSYRKQFLSIFNILMSWALQTVSLAVRLQGKNYIIRSKDNPTQNRFVAGFFQKPYGEFNTEC